MVLGLIALGVASSFICWALIGIFRRWAIYKQLLDYPNERSSHTRPTPKAGGIGIVLVVLTFGAVLLIGYARQSPIVSYSHLQIGAIIAGGLFVAAISWLDDAREGLAPGFRLIVHAAAAGLVVIVMGGWSRMAVPFLGIIGLGWVGILVAVIWIVGLINAYNFMDGIDGIAGVQAVTAAGGWLVVGLLSGNPFLAVSGMLIGCSAIGFLAHNWPPAKIFMGDIGSAFLGYSFAVLPFLASRFFKEPVAGRIPVAGFLIVSPFVIDATFTFVRRLSRRERLSQAHRSHLYQRLVISGLSHRTVTLLYSLLGLIGSAAGVSFVFLQDRLLANIIALLATVAILIVPLFWVLSREAEGSPKI